MAAPFPGSLFYDLYGAPTGLGVPPSADFPYDPSSALPDAASALQEPAAPTFVSPELAQAPMPGLRERLAAGLAALPGYQARPYESGGSRFGRGLIAGLGQGFSRGVQTDVAAKTAAAEKANAVNRAAADRTNALLADKYKAELANYYKQQADATGKFTVTQKMSDETGLPVGARVDPVTLAERKLAREQLAVSQENAKRADATLSETVRHNRAVEQAARDKARVDAQAAGDTNWMQYLIGQTTTGNKFVDLTNVGPKDKKAALSYAGALGLPAVTPAQKSRLAAIDDARANIADMLVQSKTFLNPTTDAGSTFARGLGNRAAAMTGTNPTIKAWPTWRVSAIQQLVALAGGTGSGLRINQAEIQQATENDIPKITDNYPTAQRKAANVLALLDNAEHAIVRNGEGAGLTTRIGPDGLRHIVLANERSSVAPVDPFAAGRK